ANSELKYEYHYDLGKKVGVWKSWYEDGIRYTERHFENDDLNGKVLVWDESGKLAKEYDYINGRLMNSQMHFKE
ncbi:MAG: antitoxin component YwqK of YwqJK toxin-antitoxin module, partial [Cryomorphaceae bacterium]